MNKSELLKPRYKCIADYPESHFKIGDLMMQAVDYGKLFWNKLETGEWGSKVKNIDWYPNIFKSLAWYEERKPEEMPGFVKVIESDFHRDELPFYARVRSIENDNPILTGFKLKDGTDGMYIDWSCVLPCTEQDYKDYINKKPGQKNKTINQ